MSVVAITGVSSYFARGLLPLLEADDRVHRIIGIDIRPPPQAGPKLEYHQQDVREPGLDARFEPADTVLHLAFIVDEIGDKRLSHSINVEGTRNVLRAVAACSARKVVYTSSVAAYGAQKDNPSLLDEDAPLRPTTDCYYSMDKAEVEGLFREFARTHPDTRVTILRPCLVFGPNIQNMFSRFLGARIVPTQLGKDPAISFLHEEDLFRALHQAVVEDHPGIFNLAGPDPVPLSRLLTLTGSVGIPLPAPLAKAGANFLFRLGLMPFSQAWVSMQEYPVTVSTERFEKVFGWAPRHSSEEAFRAYLDAR